MAFFLASWLPNADKNDPPDATKALRRRRSETLTRGILWESPQGWVHGVFGMPPAKRLGFTLRSTLSRFALLGRLPPSVKNLPTYRQTLASRAVLNGFLARDKSVQWGILRRDPTRYHELPPYVPSDIRAIGRSQTGRQRPSGIQ